MQLILQHCCKTNWNWSSVARFTTHFQTCLAKTEVAEVCRKLLQKVESSSTLSFFSVHDTRLLAQGKLVLQQVTPLPCMISPARNFIQSKISICATWFAARWVWRWVVKRATSLLSTQFATTFRNKLLVFLVRFTVAYLGIQPRPQGFSIQFEKWETYIPF